MIQNVYARVRPVRLSDYADRLESVVGNNPLEESARRVSVLWQRTISCRISAAQMNGQPVEGVSTLFLARLAKRVAHEGNQMLPQRLAVEALVHSHAASKREMHPRRVPGAVHVQFGAAMPNLYFPSDIE
jgi:hypothetical protein